jgi:hypothetical protein
MTVLSWRIDIAGSSEIATRRLPQRPAALTTPNPLDHPAAIL